MFATRLLVRYPDIYNLHIIKSFYISFNDTETSQKIYPMAILSCAKQLYFKVYVLSNFPSSVTMV